MLTNKLLISGELNMSRQYWRVLEGALHSPAPTLNLQPTGADQSHHLTALQRGAPIKYKHNHRTN